MTILNNELVLKYFGSTHESCPPGCQYEHKDKLANRVLQAMQKPIAFPDKCLAIGDDGSVGEFECRKGSKYIAFHSQLLRLPDRFQKRLTVGCIHGEECVCFSQPKDEVEEKINDLVDRWQYYDFQTVRKELRELVELARKT